VVNGVAVYTSTFTPATTPLTSTQSVNQNGIPSAAITGTSTALLLNTPSGGGFLTDSSTNNFTVTNNGSATSNALTPFASIGGNVTAAYGIFATSVNTASFTGAVVSVTGNVTANNGMFTNIVNVASHTGAVVSVTGNVTANNGMFTNIVNVASHTGAVVSVTGNITGGNLLTGGLISATGNIITSTNGFIGVGTSAPDSELNILATPQTVSYSLTGNSTTAGTDLHISGANGANTRITQDAFGTGSYVAFTGRTAGGTAASPTQTLSGDILTQLTARGFSDGALQFGNISTGRVDVVAAGNFTDTSRATNVQIFTTAAGAITPTAVATFSSASGLSVAGNVTSGNVATTGILTVNSGAAATAIVNGASNAVGNIGSASTYFNRLFAQATTALYADLAEVYKSDAEYPPGTVLIFGGSQEVTISTQSHDARIAGVVSTNPAHVMNSGLVSEFTVEVGLIGRVPCQVIGPVAVGDRVVSSNRAGVAERLNMQHYQPGVIIGKAVESYNSTGVGTIEVVVGRL
jgi:hypothetical protein